MRIYNYLAVLIRTLRKIALVDYNVKVACCAYLFDKHFHSLKFRFKLAIAMQRSLVIVCCLKTRFS